MAIKLASASFEQGGMIPRKYTCYTENKKGVSPELHWDAVPEEAKSLALICDDPDAVSGTNLHWLVYNLPPETRRLPEGVRRLPRGERSVERTAAAPRATTAPALPRAPAHITTSSSSTPSTAQLPKPQRKT
jgi:Raf kinase inhibitor-like YbhB/YbcL family protein